MYSLTTPPELFDIRCEYEVPRYVDLNNLEDEDLYYYGEIEPRKHSTTGGARVTQEDEFFQWFQLSHDFHVNKRFIKVSTDRERLRPSATETQHSAHRK